MRGDLAGEIKQYSGEDGYNYNKEDYKIEFFL